MTISAITTRYAGCLFRSRLEARWAVFFTHLGVDWQFEPQGYRVGTSAVRRPYLPDFHLPDWDLWVEVKPVLDAAAIELFTAAVHPRYGLPTRTRDTPHLLVLGPVPDPGRRHLHPVLFHRGGEAWRMLSSFTDHPGLTSGIFHRRLDRTPVDLLLRPAGRALRSADRAVSAAYTAARSARFEHGESGEVGA